MDVEVVIQNGITVAVVCAADGLLADGRDALDFFMSIRHETGTNRILLNKEALAEDFFILKTGLAGEILQKCVNYSFKLAVVGDFSVYASRSLSDLIYECNNGRDFFFVPTREEALEKLTS